MNKQALSAHIGSKMNALGFSADFTGASMEAWKKQSANGYMTISAHDTEAKPLFPPTSGYPFIVVSFSADGEIEAKPFSTEEEAEIFMAEKTNLRIP
jgi:hypothetical protein